MKRRVTLLDCTLRDGGYVNDWNFGQGSIKSIVSRLNSAGLDTIEVGFLDARRPYDANRSIYPDTRSILPVFSNIDKPKATIVAMIDYGTCPIENLDEKADSCLDGIRVIFKKKNQDEALELLSQIKDKGYKLFVNPVSITSYSDDEVRILVEKINKLEPDTVSIVDTYGLMHSTELLHYFKLFDSLLSPGIVLGYHAHNNFQLAYANSIAIINCDVDRDVNVDGTLYGMGKSAGNACTELLAMYLNERCDRSFDIAQIQESIDVDILKEFKKKSWGYCFEYYVAALNDCHPSYVQFLIDKKALSVKSINEIVKEIPAEKKLSYDKDLISTLYRDYQDRVFDDASVIKELKDVFSTRDILLLGPGRSLLEKGAEIQAFINDKNPILISINFLNDQFNIDYVFMGNAKRYSQFFHKIYGENSKARIICTSNITEAGKAIDYTVNYSSLLSSNEPIRDNPLVLFLHLLQKMNIQKIWLAGFDGYSTDSGSNYYDAYVPLLYCQDDVLLRNEAIRKELQALSKSMWIRSLTETKYL